MVRPVEPTSQAIVDAAYILFWRKGFHRVSLDEIAAEADVTKRTLYYHFESKDALLSAVLEAQSKLAFAAFQTFGVNLIGSPEQIVEKLFAALSAWSAKPRWAGSGFTRLVIELADLPGHPAHEIARRHKGAVERHLAEVLARAGVDLPTERAREIYLLAEGAMSLILVHGNQSYASAAAEAAKRLLQDSANLPVAKSQMLTSAGFSRAAEG